MLLLIILWPIAELAAAFAVAHAIGVLLTVLLLIAGWPIGTWLMRAEGRTALSRFRAAVVPRSGQGHAGRPPAAEVADGALVLLGGPLLIIPGFITDVLGLALLVPPVRRAAGRFVVRHARSRLVSRAAGLHRRARADDVDSTAHDAEWPQLHG